MFLFSVFGSVREHHFPHEFTKKVTGAVCEYQKLTEISISIEFKKHDNEIDFFLYLTQTWLNCRNTSWFVNKNVYISLYIHIIYEIYNLIYLKNLLHYTYYKNDYTLFFETWQGTLFKIYEIFG